MLCHKIIAPTASAGVAPVRPASESLPLRHERSQASIAWECALAPYPAAASDNVSALGRQRGSGPPVHLNPLRCSLSIRFPPMTLLQFPAPLV
jgi:hypothetical protein